MKRLIALVLAAFIMLSLAACSHSGQGNDPTPGTPGEKAAQADTEIAGQLLYGKVTSIVGNEIQLMLGSLPDTLMPEGGGSVQLGGTIPEGETVIEAGKTTIQDGAAEKLELDYSGKTMTLTIPAGVPIEKMGQESSLTSIATGTILGINVKDAKAETPDILKLLIIS